MTLDRRNIATSRNALKHGLSRNFSSDPSFRENIDRIANQICGTINTQPNERLLEAARAIAEAELHILRARRIRISILSNDSLRKGKVDHGLVRKTAREMMRHYDALVKKYGEWEAQFHMDPIEIVEFVDQTYERHKAKPGAPLSSGLHYISNLINKIDRYETRALSRRKSAIRCFTELQS